MILTNKPVSESRQRRHSFAFATLLCLVVAAAMLLASCSVSYGFREKVSSIPDTVKTVKINTIINRAPYVNPQITPNLTEKLRQKVINQTKLTLTNANAETADWEISGEVRDYSFNLSGVTSNGNGQSTASINRLTVTIHITIDKRSKVEEYDVSRSFDYAASKSPQSAEAELLDEMIRNLTDEIFNRLFSDW